MDTSKREKINPSSRYFRYRARFGFDNLADLPVLFEVRIYYDVSGMRRINNQNKKEVIQALGKYFEFFTISLLSPGVYFLIFKAGGTDFKQKIGNIKIGGEDVVGAFYFSPNTRESQGYSRMVI